MKSLTPLLLIFLAASAVAAPSNLLIQAGSLGYKIGDKSENSESSTLYKLPISAAWIDKLTVDDVRGPTGMVCRLTIKNESPSLSFLIWVHKTRDSRFSIYTFGAGAVSIGSETAQYRSGTATSTSVFKAVEDFDFSQQLTFKNGTHGKNVEISVRASDDGALLDRASAAQVVGKDGKVLIAGSATTSTASDISCSIQ